MYKFDDKRHIHMLDDKPLCGTTTVLGIIAKPNLIQWAADVAAANGMETEKVEGFLEKYEAVMKISDWKEKKKAKAQLDKDYPAFKQTRVAHRQKKEKAGDWGTELHKFIEDYIKEGFRPKVEGTQLQAFDHFMQWAIDNKVEFLESEKHLYSRELWIGGIVDMVFMMDGKKYIGDIKTGSGIYPEMWAQMGAYDLCLKDMKLHEDVEGYLIINLKKDGTMDLGLTHNTQFNQDFFKAALSLYKLKQAADESVN